MSEKVKIPEEVQQAWNVVADFLNEQKALTFFIDPWNKTDEKFYTIKTVHENEDIEIVASNSWEGADKK